jgi:glycosyltransferase involved in cell wall biosynthesis
MNLSFIVSTFHRPEVLRCLLSSLSLQTEKGIEVIVTDNSSDDALAAKTLGVVKEFDDRFDYQRTYRNDCYSSAEDGAKIASGRFLCFPSDDNYYLPQFAEMMLRCALNKGLDLVYCDCVYGRPGQTPFLLNVIPKTNHIDKGGFLIARDKFTEFPGKAPVSCSDGWFVEECVKKGVRHGKVDSPLWVHN